MKQMKTINKMVLAMFIILIPGFIRAQVKKVKHVILIGCDGFGAYAVPDAKMPNLKSLMEKGAYSLKARCVMPSSSAVNWASMLMGSGPTDHGYTEWDSKVPEIPSSVKTKYGVFPTIFSVIRDQRPEAKTAAIFSWSGIAPLLEKDAISFFVPGKSKDNFCADTAATIIKRDKPLFTFIHFSQPDVAGHTIGHRTPGYYKELESVDIRIGKIVQAVKDAGIENETIIMITADHGGIGLEHGGKTTDEIFIPWIICGKGVKSNHEIKDVIMTYDTGATIAYILGLKAPQSWRGQPVKDVFK